MKKLLTRIGALALVGAAALSLAACGAQNNFISSGATATIGEGEGAVQYSNTSSFKLNWQGNNSYKATGDANIMTAEQADAFWKGTAQEGDNFVVLSITFNQGANIVYGFDTEDANFENPDGTAVKTYTNDTDQNDTLQLILRLKQDGSKTFKVIDTEKDADAVTYTVDFTSINFKDAE